MFFNFCSDKEYERQYWCTIWDIELALQGLILGEGKPFLYLNRRTIKTKTIKLIKRLHPGIETQAHLADGWVDAFMTQELEYVLPFLRSHKDILVKRKVPQELLFHERFMTCVKSAPEFIEYLEAKTKKRKRT